MSYYKRVRVRNFDEPALTKTFNWQQLFERMGGIDGVIHRMNQLQRFVQSMQQFAPLFKTFSSSFSRNNPLHSGGDGDADDISAIERTGRNRSKRRRRKKGVLASMRRRRRT